MVLKKCYICTKNVHFILDLCTFEFFDYTTQTVFSPHESVRSFQDDKLRGGATLEQTIINLQLPTNPNLHSLSC